MTNKQFKERIRKEGTNWVHDYLCLGVLRQEKLKAHYLVENGARVMMYKEDEKKRQILYKFGVTDSKKTRVLNRYIIVEESKIAPFKRKELIF